MACRVRFIPPETERIVYETLELQGTPDEARELMGVLVRNCGCGCSYDGRAVVGPSPGCAALRALRERRFILGMLFARSLRRQLVAEESTRTRRRLEFTQEADRRSRQLPRQ